MDSIALRALGGSLDLPQYFEMAKRKSPEILERLGKSGSVKVIGSSFALVENNAE